MQLTTHFTLEEFTATEHRHIENTLPASMVEQAKKTCQMLERIRTFLGIRISKQVPIYITSGYRCSQLNAAVGGQVGSDHIRAMAVDWIAPKFGNPHEIAKVLSSAVYELNIGQLIKEYATESGGGWIHTSTRIPDKPVNRIITIDKKGTRIGV